MGIFRREKSSSSKAASKLTKEDRAAIKLNSANNLVLQAVNEAQPFEQAADTFVENGNRMSYSSSQKEIKDVFGRPVVRPDTSNPTRSRDERPLDTIRGFEYAISGDPQWLHKLQTPQYGFRVRPDFPRFGGTVDSFEGEQAVFQAMHKPAESTEKLRKKKGFFRRKL